MADLQNLSISSDGFLSLPSGTTSERPSSPNEGDFRYNTTHGVVEYYNGNSWISVSTVPYIIGQSASQILSAYPDSPSGYYLIKPSGYSGDPFYVFCDMTGDESGIGSGGWMAIQYSQDAFSRSSPWNGTGQGNTTNPAYSGDFSFVLSEIEIDALLNETSESRQKFPAYGFSSVGWTFQSPNQGRYQGAKAFDDSLHRGTDTTDNSNLIFGSSHPSSISYGFSDITSFPNSGTDPTDANDSVWREGTIYLQETTTRQYLPIKGIYNADVDGSTEQRYFPLVSEKGITWVK